MKFEELEKREKSLNLSPKDREKAKVLFSLYRRRKARIKNVETSGLRRSLESFEVLRLQGREEKRETSNPKRSKKLKNFLEILGEKIKEAEKSLLAAEVSDEFNFQAAEEILEELENFQPEEEELPEEEDQEFPEIVIPQPTKKESNGLPPTMNLSAAVGALKSRKRKKFSNY